MSHGTGTFGLTKVNESADILLVMHSLPQRFWAHRI
jgi:hypothetical protein